MSFAYVSLHIIKVVMDQQATDMLNIILYRISSNKSRTPIRYMIAARSVFLASKGRHTLRHMLRCGDVAKRGQAPSCVRIGRMLQGQYASRYTRSGLRHKNML